LRRFSSLAVTAMLVVGCSDREVPTHPAGAPAEPTYSVAPSGDFVEGRVLVRFHPGANGAALAAAHGASVERSVALGIQMLRVPAGREVAVAQALSRNPNVEFAEPDYVRTVGLPCKSASGVCTAPSDPFFGYKWDLHNKGTITNSTGGVLANTGKVGADMDWLEAFDHLGGALNGSAVIGVGDTGIRPTHQDLAGRVLAMRDFFGSTSGADDNGHGTHVAGIAAGRGNDGIGVPGVAWGPNVRIVSAKMCGPTGFGPFRSYGCPSSAITEGIKWMADQGAHAINLSLGGPNGSSSERAALQYAQDLGTLSFCATGNDNGSVSYPAAFPECVGVGATNWSDGRASYSNFGPEVELSAPGGDGENASGYSYVLSAYHDADNAYAFMAGTSMASPQAAGLAGLLRALGVTDRASILSIMKSTADDLGPAGRDNLFGEGRINVYRAVLAATGGGDPQPPQNQPPTASFSFSCSGLTCSFDGSASSDPDGSITGYAWSFGDGVSGSGVTASRTYAAGGTYNVTLTVTDNAGATGTQTRSVTVSAPSTGGITLSVNAYKVSGVQHAGLTWTGASGTQVDVYRDNTRIATVANSGSHTDNIGRRGGGSYTYRVCNAGTSTCSNNATATF
jgi:subtilisin family serine protease